MAFGRSNSLSLNTGATNSLLYVDISISHTGMPEVAFGHQHVSYMAENDSCSAANMLDIC